MNGNELKIGFYVILSVAMSEFWMTTWPVKRTHKSSEYSGQIEVNNSFMKCKGNYISMEALLLKSVFFKIGRLVKILLSLLQWCPCACLLKMVIFCCIRNFLNI